MPPYPPYLPYSPTSVAEALHTVLDDAASKRGRATLAIPGGRSPGDTLTALAGMCEPFLCKRLHLLWLDERAVPPGDEQRNDASTLAAWRAGGPLPAFVHPMPVERSDLHQAASDYASTLGDASAGHGLDACLIGIGEDGHIASLFPGHPGLKELADVFPVFDSPKPPLKRLTMSLPVLHRAGALVILALGSAKGLVAKRARLGQDPAVPVSLLPPQRCTWFLDDAATQALVR